MKNSSSLEIQCVSSSGSLVDTDHLSPSSSYLLSRRGDLPIDLLLLALSTEPSAPTPLVPLTGQLPCDLTSTEAEGDPSCERRRSKDEDEGCQDHIPR